MAFPPMRAPRPAARLLLALGGILFGCGRPQPPRDPAILELGDQVIRQSEFDQYVATVEAQGGAPLEPGVRAALTEPFLEERIVVLEARARGLATADSSPDEEQLAARRLLSAAAVAATPVTDDDVERFYHEHLSRFELAETVTLRQILVPTENEARDVRRRLLRDRHSFETLARTTSRGPEAAQGGLMGTFARGELPPELEQAAFVLAVGATSGVVATPLGCHVLLVEARAAPRQREIEECREEIRAELSRDRSEQAIRAFIRALMARAKVHADAAAAASPARP